MPLFRRREDPAARRARLERRIEAAFARHGVRGRVVRDPDDPVNTALVTPDGTTYGFANLMIRCLAQRDRDWPAIVDEFTATLARSLHDAAPVDVLDPATQPHLRARLLRDDPAHRATMTYARPFAPGVVEALCIDRPEVVDTLTDHRLEGLDLDAAFARARANLAAEAFDEVAEIAPGVTVATGASLFVASRLLDPEFQAVQLASPRGVVFAIPDRHTLMWHVVQGPASVVPIQQLTGAVRALPVEERPGGLLSREVFYLGRDGVQQLTMLDDQGATGIRAEGTFLDAIRE